MKEDIIKGYEFSSPYEELVYILLEDKGNFPENTYYVFVPLRGISLYILGINQE